MEQSAKVNFTVIVGLLLTITLGLSSFAQNTFAQANNLITPNSVGEIKIGMTVGNARKFFKGAKFEQYDYSEEGIWIEVTKEEILLIRFTTDQKDLTSDDQGQVPIDNSAKIESIELLADSASYKTADGIGIGSTVDKAEKAFGKIIKIELWEYDGSEHAWFENAPKNYSFTIEPAESSSDESTAGIYGKDEYSSTKYAKGAVISTFTVSKEEIEK